MDEQDLPYSAEEIKLLPTDIRRDLAEAARYDLLLFSRGILGYPDLTDACHGPMCVYLDKHPARFKLLMMPRGHYKTTVATISRQLQKVCQNPENRMLLANETSTNAERFLSAIKGHVEGNTRFRAFYSDVIPKDTRKVRWSQKEVEFRREGSYPEPTIDTIGMTGAWTSRHYTHITFDDPISEEAAKSDSVMEDTIGRISKVFSMMTDVEHDTFDLIGTRWAFWDVYAYMMRWLGPQMARFIRGAIEDGEPIFPEKFSLDTLGQIRNSPHMGEYSFSCQYMNNPRNPELQDFNVADLRFWKWSSDEEHIVLYDRDGEVHRIVELDKLDVVCTVDPAPAEKITSDRNAIVVSGVTPDGDVVVLDTWARRCTPLEVIDHLFEVKKRYHPRVFGVEGVAYQKVLKYFVRAEGARRNEYFNVVDLKAPGKNKIHIRGLQPIAATGHLYILPTMHQLRSELSDFPLGEFDDVADALALGQQLWRGLMSPEKWSKYKESEKRLLRDIEGYGVKSDMLIPAGVQVGPGPIHPKDIPHPDDLDIDPEQAPIYTVELGV